MPSYNFLYIEQRLYNTTHRKNQYLLWGYGKLFKLMTFIIELSQKITATKVIFGVRSKIGIIIVAIHSDVATTKFLIGFTPHRTAHFYRCYNHSNRKMYTTRLESDTIHII